MSELHDLAAFYALDALDHDERRSFEDHLATCDRCQAELVDLRAGADALVTATAEPPPRHVKDAVMADIDDTVVRMPSRGVSSRSRWLVAAAAAVLAVIIGLGLAGDRGSDPVDLVLDADDAASTIVVNEQIGSVSIVWSDLRREAVLRTDALPPIAADETYALWIVGGDGPEPAGLFRPDDGGSAYTLIEGPAGTGSTIGLTVEPAGGSPQPTGEILLLAELG